MPGTFEYELFWEGGSIGRLVKAEPDVPYVEGEWLANGTESAVRFSSLLNEVFAGTDTVHWSKAPRVEVLHANGHRSKGYVTGFGAEGMFIRW